MSKIEKLKIAIKVLAIVADIATITRKKTTAGRFSPCFHIDYITFGGVSNGVENCALCAFGYRGKLSRVEKGFASYCVSYGENGGVKCKICRGAVMSDETEKPKYSGYG